MPRVGKRIALALIVSSFSSLTYLGLALYQLFEIAEQDKRMFILLVSFTVEVVFWSIYLLSMCFSFSSSPRWHLSRITLPLWDLVFVLLLTDSGLQLPEVSGVTWWDFDAQSLYFNITIVAILAALPLKLISAAVLSEYYHRSYVREGTVTYHQAYDEAEQSIALTGFSQPTAPSEEVCSY